jgi:uncharacterized protein (TIGR03437 family)
MIRVCYAAIAGLLVAAPLLAQQDLLLKTIDDSRRVTLKGNRNSQATPESDRGEVDGNLHISGITFSLKSSSEQQAELERFLDDVQDPASPNHHHWLTPEQFADRFSLSVNDFERIASWVAAQGFQVDYKARGRSWIAFSGSAAQVKRSFGTAIDVYETDNERHYANETDPSIPADLEPFVQAIHGLDDFRLKPRARVGKEKPFYTDSNGNHFVGPSDLATIYNVSPLYNRQIDGSGQKIVIVGQTDFKLSDVEAFRRGFGLPTNDPQKLLVPGFPNPGITADEGEAIIDLEYSGGIAFNAAILYVYSNRVEFAAAYAIDQNLAPVLSMSYGLCELKLSSSDLNASEYRSFAQQAAAEGITWVASSGDSGAAGCEPQVTSKAGISGPAVALPAGIPEVTGVGGTEFSDGSGNYWNSNNNSVTQSSARSYIPEIAWNDTSSLGDLASTGGGASIFFSKPAWQTGAGVPNDNKRDVPDVSLNASFAHDAYVIFLEGQLQSNGGTSAAARTFAGMLALLNQSIVLTGGKAGLGNINPNLYRLAQTNPSVFHDITIGSNFVPCSPGSTSCPPSGQYGYAAGPGYDQATGLGSVDANALVTQWQGGSAAQSPISTSNSVTASPSTIQVNGSTLVTATVHAASGTTSPLGQVSFNLGQTTLGTAPLAGSGGSSTASLTIYGSQLKAGSNSITAFYGGTTAFSASSGTRTVTVTVPTAASSVVPSIVPSPIYQQAPDADGYAWFFTVRLTEIGGVASKLTGFTFGSVDYSSSILDFFGSSTLPAHGTLSAPLRASGLTVPVDRVFTFSGVDASGGQWSQQLTATFLPQQISASILLTSSPSVEKQNPAGDPNCDPGYPYYQELNLQEQNGVGLTLTKFLAGGFDETDSIQDYFGGYRIAPLGTLRAGICWSLDTVPATLQYEVDGIDTAGNTITTTTSVLFEGPGQSPGALSVSDDFVYLTAPSQSTTYSVTVRVPAGESWSVSKFPANQTSSWLTVVPQSGTGATNVKLIASTAGLKNGVYTATLVFQSTNTIPQFYNTDVTFVIGASLTTSIGAVTNGASFDTNTAPGMIMAVFGSKLANSTKSATSVPLPLSLDGVSATINGVPAPLYFVSPGQLNVQVPYETPAGYATLGVINNGQVDSYSFLVSPTAPGLFTGAKGVVVPVGSASRGQTVVLFMTGEGDTLPALATGAAPPNSTPISKLPAPRQPVTLAIGGVPVTPSFVGIPFGLVGVTQINFVVPAAAPLGPQTVVVIAGGVESKAATINISSAATGANSLLSTEELVVKPAVPHSQEEMLRSAR